MSSHCHANKNREFQSHLLSATERTAPCLILQPGKTQPFCFLHLLTVLREVTGAACSDQSHCNLSTSDEAPNSEQTWDSSCLTSQPQGHGYDAQLSHASLVQGRFYTVHYEALVWDYSVFRQFCFK